MKRILFITTQYRVGERIYPIIPYLAKEYKLDLLRVYQMSPLYRWIGDKDLRTLFDKTYLKYFDKVFNKICPSDHYDLIISDDNRYTPKTNLDKIYNNKRCLMIGCTHGNGDNPYLEEGYKTVFDKCFVFGKQDSKYDYCIPIGIPSNDDLVNYKNCEKKHILIIVNFLGNRKSPFKVNYDENFFKNINIKVIQQEFELPILIKLKSRDDEGGHKHNIEYLNKILPDSLDFNIVVDVENDNKLIGESICVISSPSTMAFKSIQLGIPTVLIKNSGQTSCFKDYDGLFDINDDMLTYIKQYKLKEDFLNNTLVGGIDFNSTSLVLEKIKEFLNEKY